MRILIVASINKGGFAPFVEEQADALKRMGCEVEFFGIQGKGLKGYLTNLPVLKQKIISFHPDVLHAHYGLSGLLASLQRKVPVVVTFHGSDINDKKIRRFSRMSMRLSAWSVFVSKKTIEMAKPKDSYSLLSCGIDLSVFQPTNKPEARRLMHLSESEKYILFAGAFDNGVKNSELAKQAVGMMQNPGAKLLELKGHHRKDVALLLCAADALLMTSHSEGSPQIIKEAMACGCPIVSVDVGDVRERVEGVEGCYVANSREPAALAELLRKAVDFEGRTEGRVKIVSDGLENSCVAEKLMVIYRNVCNR